jgi:hypothetical protein
LTIIKNAYARGGWLNVAFVAVEAAFGAVMGVFDSDQFHATLFDLAKLCGTVLCEEEGRSPCESSLAGSALPDPKKSPARFVFAGMTKL